MASETNKNHWIRLGIVVGLFLLGTPLILSTADAMGLTGATIDYLFYGWFAVILGLNVRALILYRCPSCKKNLFLSSLFFASALWVPKRCPKCKEALP